MVMSVRELEVAAQKADRSVSEIEKYRGASDAIDSVGKQMKFIARKASEGRNQVQELNGNKFTYSLIASKEFDSPEEKSAKMIWISFQTFLIVWVTMMASGAKAHDATG